MYHPALMRRTTRAQLLASVLAPILLAIPAGSASAAAVGEPSPLAFRHVAPLHLARASSLDAGSDAARDAARRAPVSVRSETAIEVAGAGAFAGLGFLLDDSVEPGSGEDTFYDDLGGAAGNFYVLAGGTGLFALHSALTDNDRNLDVSKDVAIALGATTATVGVLKAVVSRERPDESNEHSFPSGHAANSFAVATVLERHYGGAVGWIAYGAAAFIASSRVIGNHHWLSDVTTGAAIGFLWGRLITSGS